jgi:hypothetical protein
LGPKQRGIHALIGFISCMIGATFLFLLFILPYY